MFLRKTKTLRFSHTHYTFGGYKRNFTDNIGIFVRPTFYFDCLRTCLRQSMHLPRKIRIFILYFCQALGLGFDTLRLLCVRLLFIFKAQFTLDILHKISDDIFFKDTLEKYLKCSLFARKETLLKRTNKFLPESQHD